MEDTDILRAARELGIPGVRRAQTEREIFKGFYALGVTIYHWNVWDARSGQMVIRVYEMIPGYPYDGELEESYGRD